MAATSEDISAWFDRGVEQKARHMLVVCDSFDHDDYPVFTTTDADCLRRYKNPGEMQRVMEVYDLRADKAEQMNERRAMRLPYQVNAPSGMAWMMRVSPTIGEAIEVNADA